MNNTIEKSLTYWFLDELSRVVRTKAEKRILHLSVL